MRPGTKIPVSFLPVQVEAKVEFENAHSRPAQPKSDCGSVDSVRPGASDAPGNLIAFRKIVEIYIWKDRIFYRDNLDQQKYLLIQLDFFQILAFLRTEVFSLKRSLGLHPPHGLCVLVTSRTGYKL